MLKKPLDSDYPVTQDWNDPRYRSSYTKFGLLGHNGIDYGVPTGKKVIAPHDGKIIESLFDANGYGWYVKIENEEEGSILAHFKEQSSCKVGSTVKQGEQVGLSGNTGNSTGPHLHWGYYRFPRKKDNGFSGTVDQTHWIELKNYKEEYEYEKEEKEKYKKEARELRETVKSQAEEIAQLGEEIKRLDQANAGHRAEIAQLQAQFAEVSRERDSLLDCCKGYEVAVPKLNAKINDLETKLISQNPLKDYSAKELLNAFFDKIFRR